VLVTRLSNILQCTISVNSSVSAMSSAASEMLAADRQQLLCIYLLFQLCGG
jgi:hypothetical protein